MRAEPTEGGGGAAPPNVFLWAFAMVQHGLPTRRLSLEHPIQGAVQTPTRIQHSNFGAAVVQPGTNGPSLPCKAVRMTEIRHLNHQAAQTNQLKTLYTHNTLYKTNYYNIEAGQHPKLLWAARTCDEVERPKWCLGAWQTDVCLQASMYPECPCLAHQTACGWLTNLCHGIQ